MYPAVEALEEDVCVGQRALEVRHVRGHILREAGTHLQVRVPRGAVADVVPLQPVEDVGLKLGHHGLQGLHSVLDVLPVLREVLDGVLVAPIVLSELVQQGDKAGLRVDHLQFDRAFPQLGVGTKEMFITGFEVVDEEVLVYMVRVVVLALDTVQVVVDVADSVLHVLQAVQVHAGLEARAHRHGHHLVLRGALHSTDNLDVITMIFSA